jgi:hypothetical protein
MDESGRKNRIGNLAAKKCKGDNITAGKNPRVGEGLKSVPYQGVKRCDRQKK